MNEHLQRARRLISSVSLTDVRLVDLHTKTSIRSDKITADLKPIFKHWASAPEGLNAGIFFVRANLDLRIGGENTPPVVLVKIQYELEYKVPADFKASRAELASFAKINGVFNAWPYFREIVQTATLRMNLPPVILPVYRVPQPASSKTITPADQPPATASE